MQFNFANIPYLPHLSYTAIVMSDSVTVNNNPDSIRLRKNLTYLHFLFHATICQQLSR